MADDKQNDATVYLGDKPMSPSNGRGRSLSRGMSAPVGNDSPRLSK